MKRALLLVLLATGCQAATLDSFLYDPLPEPAGGYQLSTAVIPGHQDFYFQTLDGVKLHAAYVPSSGRRADITLVYFHGQSNNIGSSWPRLEYLYPLGYNLMLLDYRGFGRSTGKPDEPGLRIDSRAARAGLLAATGADPQKLVYYGRSLGGAVAIDLASTDPPGVLVTESTFTSVAAFVSDGAGYDLPRSFVASSVWDSLSKIPGIASPYLAFHGLADDYVQPKYSIELTAAHNGVTKLILVPGAGHGDAPDVELPGHLGYDAYRAALRDFIEQAL
jgi:pimeloyl-ACP methyl ester carboxylesterase